MFEQILKNIFSFSGLSVVIGVVGVLSGLVTIFINTSDQLSIKWLLFTLLVGISLTVILLKVIYDLSQETTPPSPFEHPTQYLPDQSVFIIKRNENFSNNILVGCYELRDDVERLAYLGAVHHIQERIIQIRVVSDYGHLAKPPSTKEELKSIIIRPVVPLLALQQINTQEN